MQYEKKLGFDGKFTYGMENISTSKRNLMNSDELLKLDNNKEIIIVTMDASNDWNFHRYLANIYLGD